MVKEKKVSQDTKRKNLSFIQLIFPVFLLAIIPSNIGDSVILPFVLKVLLFGYQYYLTQHFVESAYN